MVDTYIRKAVIISYTENSWQNVHKNNCGSINYLTKNVQKLTPTERDITMDMFKCMKGFNYII